VALGVVNRAHLGCPFPLKRAYPNRRFALMVAARQQARDPKRPMLRPYKCACRAWHLTSRQGDGW